MACILSGGLTKDCNYLIGGLSELYLVSKSQFSGASSTNGVITAITMSGGSTFKKIEFEKNTGAFTNELTVSNGQKYITQSVSFSLAKKDASVIIAADEIALGEFVAIAKDRNGNRYLLGRYNGLQASVTTMSSGSGEGDFAGLSVTLTGAEIEFSQLVNTTIPGF